MPAVPTMNENEAVEQPTAEVTTDPADIRDKDHPDADAYGRLPFPGLTEKDPDGGDDIDVKLTSVPDAYNSKYHRPLVKSNFKDDAFYFEYKALLCEQQATKYRKEAEDFRRLGSTDDRKKAKKLQTLQKRLADLKAELSGQGVDVDALLGSEDSE